MEIINEYEAIQGQAAELDLVHVMRLTLWERNALEHSREFVNEEMRSFLAEYLDLVEGRGR